MNMRKFDESSLILGLGKLPTSLRVAFAAACAERQMLAYRRFESDAGRGGPDGLETALLDVWENPGAVVEKSALSDQIDEIMGLIPTEGLVRHWTQTATNAQNAGMAVVYALRARLTGEAQDAAWAARVAYEALDNVVINGQDIDVNSAEARARVVAHPLIQAELARQERDLTELQRDDGRPVRTKIDALRARARAEAAEFTGLRAG